MSINNNLSSSLNLGYMFIADALNSLSPLQKKIATVAAGIFAFLGIAVLAALFSKAQEKPKTTLDKRVDGHFSILIDAHDKIFNLTKKVEALEKRINELENNHEKLDDQVIGLKDKFKAIEMISTLD